MGYATANGTATAGSDYTAVSGELTIPAGQHERDDHGGGAGRAVVEPDRDVPVNAEQPGECDDRRTATATGDDHERRCGGAGGEHRDVTVVEGNAGTTDAVFPVTLSAASDGAGDGGVCDGERDGDGGERLHGGDAGR